ncbi:dTDP-4-amino-4,6-dideoxygalactose transaminase [Haloactinopolyspora alba]|uniref:dTDP-4-amino-4,6-dideoxygalactose transaminase n=1 Tax=Haloactinopolyspora alba TaxID=648780 RepID=A0A2P8DID2_9ACTN|nr:DegT/DnrJ/EryC1/StrS family aminotransferase [Haloactinopolyspora alba]PSK96919.1 dTDP-4-amino-4,6-dideoxygalactose transaminase [Haloactinopolyspora alba]
MTDGQDLAVDGGPAVRTGPPLPSAMSADGRRIGAEEEAAVLRVLRSGMLSGVWGPEVPALAREFAEQVGSGHAVACSSGTAALHLAVAAVDPEPGDEIIVPPISDIGSVAPVLAQNAVPVFADVDPVTGCLDPDRVAELVSPRTRAIVVVHLFGKAADVTRLRALADANGVMLIEDCAQAYLTPVSAGSALAGTAGHLGCFSLQQHKHVTAGDGGLVVTDDAGLAERMRRFADKGWPRETGERAYLHFALNYRMTELVAAVAREQLRKLPDVVTARRRHAARLTAQLADLPGATLPADAGDHSYWYYPLLIDGLDEPGLQRYAAALTSEGVPAVPGYLRRPLYAEPVLREPRTYGMSGYPLRGSTEYSDGLCPVAESLVYRRLVVLPCNENFTDADVDDVAAAVRKVHTRLATGGAA